MFVVLDKLIPHRIPVLFAKTMVVYSFLSLQSSGKYKFNDEMGATSERVEKIMVTNGR